LTKTGEKRKIKWFGTVCSPAFPWVRAHPAIQYFPSNFVTPVWLGVWRLYVRGDPHRW
jgi:hypothetical protein